MSQYSSCMMSGAQPVPRQRITVSSHVFVQDGDAGAAQRVYQATRDEIEKNKRTPGLPMRTALWILGLCAAAVLIAFLHFTAQKSALTRRIDTMNATIKAIEQENHELDIQLVSARDGAVISYKAVQELGMISAESAETYYVTAPATRTPASAAASVPGVQTASAGY